MTSSTQQQQRTSAQGVGVNHKEHQSKKPVDRKKSLDHSIRLCEAMGIPCAKIQEYTPER